MYKTLDAPLSTHLEITTGCNQQCSHCYNFWRSEKPKLNMNLDEKTALRIVEQLAVLRVFHVILTGGEPLINLEVLLFVMKELSKRGITFSLNSNLALLNEKIARELKKAGLNTVLASLLSYDMETHDFLSNTRGSFKRVIRGINIAKMSGLKIGVNMVVSKINLPYVKKTGEFVNSLGVFAFSATRVMEPRSKPNNFSNDLLLDNQEVQMIVDQMLALKKTGLQLNSLVPYPTCFFKDDKALALLGKRTCSAGKTSSAIASDGTVRACPHHEVVYGSIINEDFSSIWEKMSQWRDGSLIPEPCRICSFFPRCGGGCRIASSDENLCGKDKIMKSEEDVPLNFIKHLPNSSVITENTLLRVKFTCRFRKDMAMGIINTGGIRNTFVSHDTLLLFEKLGAEKAVFTPQVVREKYGILMDQHEYLNFFGELIIRGVLERVGGKEANHGTRV